MGGVSARPLILTCPTCSTTYRGFSFGPVMGLPAGSAKGVALAAHQAFDWLPTSPTLPSFQNVQAVVQGAGAATCLLSSASPLRTAASAASNATLMSRVLPTILSSTRDICMTLTARIVMTTSRSNAVMRAAPCWVRTEDCGETRRQDIFIPLQLIRLRRVTVVVNTERS